MGGPPAQGKRGSLRRLYPRLIVKCGDLDHVFPSKRAYSSIQAHPSNLARIEQNPRRLRGSGAHSPPPEHALDATIRRLKIASLRAQLEVCRLQEVAFAEQFERSSTFDQKAAIAHDWDMVCTEVREMRLALDFLEKQERESKPH